MCTFIITLSRWTGRTPGLRYKIPVFSDPDPGKSQPLPMKNKRFLSNPDPGENLVSGNLVMETGSFVIHYIHYSLYSLHCIHYSLYPLYSLFVITLIIFIIIICIIILYYPLLCYIICSSIISYYIILQYVLLYYIRFYYFTLYYPLQVRQQVDRDILYYSHPLYYSFYCHIILFSYYHTRLSSTMLYSILLYYIIVYYIMYYYIILYYIMHYYIILHYIILYYVLLYYIILYYLTLSSTGTLVGGPGVRRHSYYSVVLLISSTHSYYYSYSQ